MAKNDNTRTRKRKEVEVTEPMFTAANDNLVRLAKKLCRNMKTMLNAFEPGKDAETSFSTTVVHWKTVSLCEGKEDRIQPAVVNMSTWSIQWSSLPFVEA